MSFSKRFYPVVWTLFLGLSVFYFSACQCDSNVLKENTWVLEQYGPEDALTEVVPASTPPGSGVITIQFSDDDKVNGNDGCNAYFGTYEQENCKLTVANLQSTLILCTDEAVMTQAASYMQILKDVNAFRTNNNRLRLCTDDGRELHYRKE